MKLEHILFAALLGFFLFGCGSHADGTKGQAELIQPIITTAEFVVGVNCFAFGLFKTGKPQESADVKLRLFAIDGSEVKFAAEAQAPYHPVNKLKQARAVHRHTDETVRQLPWSAAPPRATRNLDARDVKNLREIERTPSEERRIDSSLFEYRRE